MALKGQPGKLLHPPSLINLLRKRQMPCHFSYFPPKKEGESFPPSASKQRPSQMRDCHNPANDKSQYLGLPANPIGHFCLEQPSQLGLFPCRRAALSFVLQTVSGFAVVCMPWITILHYSQINLFLLVK